MNFILAPLFTSIVTATPVGTLGRSKSNTVGSASTSRANVTAQQTPVNTNFVVNDYLINWGRWQGDDGDPSNDKEVMFPNDPRYTPAQMYANIDQVVYAFWALVKTNSGCQLHSTDYGTDFYSIDTWNMNEDALYHVRVRPSIEWDEYEKQNLVDRLGLGNCPSCRGNLYYIKNNSNPGQQFHNKKIMMSVGGWTYSYDFSYCIKPENIDRTMQHITLQMQRFGKFFNGIDIDWEYPLEGGDTAMGPDYPYHDPADWTNYSEFLRRLKAIKHLTTNNEMRLGCAARSHASFYENFPVEMCELLDEINMMSYDIYGGFSDFADHNSAFYRANESGHSAEEFRGMSVAEPILAMKQKCGHSDLAIHLGIPTYGRMIQQWNFQLFKRPLEPRFVPYIGPMGDFLDTDVFTFRAFQREMEKNWGIIYLDLGSMGTYYYGKRHKESNESDLKYRDRRLQDNVASSVDTLFIVCLKTMWAQQNGLAGVFFWDGSTDSVDHDVQRVAYETKLSGHCDDRLVRDAAATYHPVASTHGPHAGEIKSLNQILEEEFARVGVTWANTPILPSEVGGTWNTLGPANGSVSARDYCMENWCSGSGSNCADVSKALMESALRSAALHGKVEYQVSMD